jgi:hypothetical protein
MGVRGTGTPMMMAAAMDKPCAKLVGSMKSLQQAGGRRGG